MTKQEEIDLPDSCWNRAKQGELMFVLLERDKAAPETIRQWARVRVATGMNSSIDLKIDEALEIAKKMEERQQGPTTAEKLAAMPKHRKEEFCKYLMAGNFGLMNRLMSDEKVK